MTETDALMFVGGTGPAGRGLARRFAAAGEAVVIGSRDRARAETAAAEVRAAVPGASVAAAENVEAIRCCRRIVLTLPATGLPEFLAATGPALAGRLVVDVTVPLRMRDGFAEIVPLDAAASAGEFVQAHAPGARVVSAFKNVAAERLLDLSQPLEGDVLVCGDDAAARAEVAALASKLPGLRAIDAGRLANARYVEAITALLVNLNRRHKRRTSIAVVGLDGGRP